MRHRSSTNENFIWGAHSVEACLENSPESVVELFVDKRELEKPRPKQEIDKILRLAKSAGLSFQAFSSEPAFLKERRHQGVYARLSDFPGISFAQYQDEFRTQLRDSTNSKMQWACLDGIQDPRNFGAIVRSAAAFGVRGVFVGSRNQAPINGVVAQTSAGNIFRIPIVFCSNINQVLTFAEEEFMTLLALDMSGKSVVEYFRKQLHGSQNSLLWIVGAEGEGLRSSVLERCSQVLKLPMASGVESLNASVALSLAFYEAATR